MMLMVMSLKIGKKMMNSIELNNMQ